MNFRRITSGASWIPQIDGLRFIAIFSVLLFHFLVEILHRGTLVLTPSARAMGLVRIISNGDRGVWLFFVISGYILARPFLRQHRLGGHKVSLPRYFMRRITRLEPPYVLSLLIALCTLAFVFHISLRSQLPHLAASLFYVHNLVFHGMSTLNLVAWTLEIEIQFYLLAPLLCTVYLIESTLLRRVLLVGLVVSGSVLSLLVPASFPVTILSFGQYFLAGLLLADLLEYPRHADNPGWAWDLVSLCGWPIVFLLPRGAATQAWLPFLMVPLCLAAFRGVASNWFFRQPLIALTGGMCYSIYLMHMYFMAAFFRLIHRIHVGSDDLTIVLQMLLLIVTVMAPCTAYYLLIERPCMDPQWPQKLWAHVRGRGHDSLSA